MKTARKLIRTLIIPQVIYFYNMNEYRLLNWIEGNQLRANED